MGILLDYNGAFSFNPNRFTCSKEGDNILLLTTNGAKVYLLEKGKFEQMNIDESGNYTFVMKDVTDSITNSDELAEYLGIEL